MNKKTTNVCVSSLNSTPDVNILTAKRAAEEFCAEMNSMGPQIQYIGDLTEQPVEFLYSFLMRHLMLLKNNRPALTRAEAEVLLLALEDNPGWCIRDPGDFARHIEEAMNDVLLPDSLAKTRNGRAILSELLRKMSELEIASIVDSADQWWSSHIDCDSFEDLELYFNLIAGRRVTWNG